jgi:DNA-binding protein H-NS
MARKSNLASMSVEALFKLRDDVAEALSTRARELQQQLSKLTGGEIGNAKRRGRPPGSSRKGRKAARKYRGPKGVTWSGRGLKPRWLVAELKKVYRARFFGHKFDLSGVLHGGFLPGETRLARAA